MSAKAGQKPDKGGRHGSVRVPIYRTVTRTGISWVAAWYEGSQRKRKGFSDESVVSQFAQNRRYRRILASETILARTAVSGESTGGISSTATNLSSLSSTPCLCDHA